MPMIGKRCKISSHSFICEGVTIEDNVFIGHSVTFINDSFPRATTAEGDLQTEADWKVERTVIKKGASIGSGTTDSFQRHRRRKLDRWGRKRSHERRCSPIRSWQEIPRSSYVLMKAKSPANKFAGRLQSEYS